MLTQPAPLEVSRTQPHTVSKIAVGLTANNRLVVAGITSGKLSGRPAVLSTQIEPFGNNNWQPGYLQLRGPVGMNYLTDLVVAAGNNLSHVVGLGNDGNIYCAGSENAGQWTPGAGLLSQVQTFLSGTLSAQIVNTATVFALSNLGAPWVAAYRDQQAQPQWQRGYALPNPTGATFKQLAARPDTSDLGPTHAIGLTTGGQAVEVATARGRGTGAGNWSPGAGVLGQASGLPAFVQLLAISGDNAGNFHVIGLGADGSVWDIDQYTANAAAPKWTKVSQLIAPAGTCSTGKIGCYVGSGLSLNLVAWQGSRLTVFACFTASWSTTTTVIPTSGIASEWHLAANCKGSVGTEFILGVAGTGLVYELAYLNSHGAWEAGAQVPINQ